MTTNDEAAQLLLERALKTIDPAIVTDIWDSGDWSDEYPLNVRPIYIRKLRTWLSSETGLLRVEAILDDSAEVPTNFAVSTPTLGGGAVAVQPAKPLYGNGFVLLEWNVSLADMSDSPGLRQVAALGWVPELVNNPGGRGRSPYETPGQVVSAVSAVLAVNAGSWNASMGVEAVEVKNAPLSFQVKVRSAGVAVASSALVPIFSALVNKLQVVNLGTLAVVTAVDSTTVGLSFNN